MARFGGNEFTEAGKRKNPSLPILQRLATALGVPVRELLG